MTQSFYDFGATSSNGLICAVGRHSNVLVALAERHGVSVDEIVTRELEDVACAHAEELEEAVPSLGAVFAGT